MSPNEWRVSQVTTVVPSPGDAAMTGRLISDAMTILRRLIDRIRCFNRLESSPTALGLKGKRVSLVEYIGYSFPV
jgi:hypothetical protein